MTLVCAFAIRVFVYPRVLFQYYEEHQYPIRGQILKPFTCVERAPGLLGNVMHIKAYDQRILSSV
jgi:hypothetical protein